MLGRLGRVIAGVIVRWLKFGVGITLVDAVSCTI
jgi:hypothetical protein